MRDTTGTFREEPDAPRVPSLNYHLEMGEQTEIGFFPDWGNRWSLWGVGPIRPPSLGLSAELTDDLARWTNVWQDDLDPVLSDIWANPKQGWEWIYEGRSLTERLRDAVGVGVTVIPDFEKYAPKTADPHKTP